MNIFLNTLKAKFQQENNFLTRKKDDKICIYNKFYRLSAYKINHNI